jgi:hypothetical protein
MFCGKPLKSAILGLQLKFLKRSKCNVLLIARSSNGKQIKREKQLNYGVRIGSMEEVGFKSATENRQRLHRGNVFRKTVPHLRTGHWGSLSTDCRQLEGWHHQAVGTSRAEGLMTRETGDMNNWSAVTPAHSSAEI